jgi:hypothetical protein
MAYNEFQRILKGIWDGLYIHQNKAYWNTCFRFFNNVNIKPVDKIYVLSNQIMSFAFCLILLKKNKYVVITGL